MSLFDYWARVQGRYYRTGARLLFKRPFVLNSDVPLISFTFDDFPRSALQTGGAILKHYGLNATYYASFGLMGTQAPTGSIFVAEDLKELFEQGHELGCHTFSHCHSAETTAGAFEDSIIENQRALNKILPGVSFRTLSYPISPPRAWTKHKVAKHFVCCRGGGQTLNIGTADLNYLSAYFLEKSRDNVQAVKDLIHQNQRVGGWLIFATHDISENPTPYGCTPKFFEEVVQCAASSDARILPVAEALEVLGAAGSREDSANHPTVSHLRAKWN
jgi:peptidoglycan/xylan/chitin deacetylase (PgdA/CDA1 family)